MGSKRLRGNLRKLCENSTPNLFYDYANLMLDKQLLLSDFRSRKIRFRPRSGEKQNKQLGHISTIFVPRVAKWLGK
ncbi:hypothetical protein EPI10_001552 [Gossypium australe]|uniref:Uncharacterized protein n=1 Tax=Gossypium australe TaxID=47621 RepID=A0A5B6VBR6_9ROSI|nr:hypothetical protein EPI10_001552 [Gossypium australe]